MVTCKQLRQFEQGGLKPSKPTHKKLQLSEAFTSSYCLKNHLAKTSLIGKTKHLSLNEGHLIFFGAVKLQNIALISGVNHSCPQRRLTRNNQNNQVKKCFASSKNVNDFSFKTSNKIYRCVLAFSFQNSIYWRKLCIHSAW